MTNNCKYMKYVCTTVKKPMQDILAAINTNELVVEIRPKKNSGSNGIWTHDLWTELKSQLGADYWIGSIYTIKVMNNDYRYMKIIYVHCGVETNKRDARS